VRISTGSEWKKSRAPFVYALACGPGSGGRATSPRPAGAKQRGGAAIAEIATRELPAGADPAYCRNYYEAITSTWAPPSGRVETVWKFDGCPDVSEGQGGRAERPTVLLFERATPGREPAPPSPPPASRTATYIVDRTSTTRTLPHLCILRLLRPRPSEESAHEGGDGRKIRTRPA